MSGARRRAQRATLGALVLVLALAPAGWAAGEKRRKPPVAPPPAPVLPDSASLGSERTPISPSLPTLPPGSPAPPNRKTFAYDLVRVAQDVRIEEDEIVRGDVVVLGGDLRIDGEVQGGAVVLGGSIDVGPRARVHGETIALGGRVDAAPGADLQGGDVSLGITPRPLVGGVDWERARRIGALLGDLLGFVALLAWCMLVAWVAPRRLQRARSWLASDALRTTGLGVLVMTGGLFAVVMGIVLLAITLVGLPLSILLALATGILLLVAQALGVLQFGSWLRSSFGSSGGSRWGAALWGAGGIVLPDLGADALRIAGTERVLALSALHILLVFVTLAAGLGALALSRLGSHMAGEPSVRLPRPEAPLVEPPGQPAA